MPKAKSDYTEEIKLRASKKFINMCKKLHSMERSYFLGDKNLSEFIRAAILYWYEIHAPKLMHDDIPEVKQYNRNKKKVIRNRESLIKSDSKHLQVSQLERLLKFGAKRDLLNYYFNENFENS